MILDIRHTGIVVANLDEALYFWCEVLGFVVIKEMEESGPYIDAMMGLTDAKVSTFKLRAPDGGMIELLHFLSHPDKTKWAGKPYSTGITHIAMSVSNLYDVSKKIQIAGGVFFAPPQLSPDGAVKVAYCQGPEGILLELVEVL